MLNVIKYPNRELFGRSELVAKVNAETNEIMDAMLEVMLTVGGVGLAAPQVGIQQRIIVAKPAEDELIVLANPEIIESEGEQVSEEGCLSLPGAKAKVKRASTIKVKGLGRGGEEIHLNLNGLPAAIIQHEIDHLDGKTIMQRVDFNQKRQLTSQMKKYNRNVKRAKKASIR